MDTDDKPDFDPGVVLAISVFVFFLGAIIGFLLGASAVRDDLNWHDKKAKIVTIGEDFYHLEPMELIRAKKDEKEKP